MQMAIKILLAGIMFLSPVLTYGADTEYSKIQAYGIWEVDAKDTSYTIRQSRESNGPGPFRVFCEFTEKNITVNIFDGIGTKLAPRSQEIWWISRNGSIYFSYGKQDNLVVFLDNDTIRVEFDEIDDPKIIMRRSSASEMERIEKDFQDALDTAQKLREQNKKRQEQNPIPNALKMYATAQVTFQVARMGRNPQNTKSGVSGFADNFRNLYYGFPPGTENAPIALELISKEIADAFRSPPAGAQTVSTSNYHPGEPKTYHGYFFVDDQACDYSRNFALFAFPVSSLPVSKIYWIDQVGILYFREVQSGENVEHPRDPSSKWVEWTPTE